MIDQGAAPATSKIDAARHRGMLLQAISVARQSRAHGNHPFGASLADPEDRLLLTAENTVVTAADATGHAETNLVRLAGPTYSLAQLRTFTLYTTTEPCAMCSAAIYWVGIGTVVFALAETDLREMTGADVRNPTLALPCRDVFTAGSRPVNVHGPFELAEARDVHGEDSGTRRTRQRQNSLYGRVSHVTSTARYTRRTAGRSRRGDRPLAVTAYAVNSRGLIDMYADYVRPERSARRLLLA